MADNSIIKIDGKAFKKLVEVISSGIGTLYRPRAIRKEAEAEAYKIEIIERAKSKAIAEGREIETDMYLSIQDRLIYQERRRQLNIDNISEIAAKQLEQENIISDEHVDKDWTTSFFNIAQDISDDEMQALWGRILAGEVKQPKSFSLRTLELLKTLSKEEANILMKVANFAIHSYGTTDTFLFKGSFKELEKFGITSQEIFPLIECGIIQPGDFIVLQFKQEFEGSQINYLAGQYIIIVDIQKCPTLNSMPIHLFTKAGVELLRLTNITPDLNYLSAFAKAFNSKSTSFKCEVKYAHIEKINDDSSIAHSIPADFE